MTDKSLVTAEEKLIHEENKSAAETSARAPDVKSWVFWRKRLARALLLGGLALGVTKLLPALPEDQRIEFVAPEGATVDQLDLTYFEEDPGEPLAGTTLLPTDPTPRLLHLIRLPNGNYLVQVDARGKVAGGQPKAWKLRRTVSLHGSTTRVPLAP